MGNKRYIFDDNTVYYIVDIEGITYTSFNIFEGSEENFLIAFPYLEESLIDYKNRLE